jgi:hypothetical protein
MITKGVGLFDGVYGACLSGELLANETMQGGGWNAKASRLDCRFDFYGRHHQLH